jgi:hypothetical protein
MRGKRFLNSTRALLVLMAMLFLVTACQSEERIQKTEPTLGVEVQPTAQPNPSQIKPLVTVEEPAIDPSEELSGGSDSAPSAKLTTTKTQLEEYVSVTELFNLKVPTGWSMQEAVPGGDLVMANSDAALERFRSGSALVSGDFALNVGFLPLALLQEKEFSHLGLKFEASPEVLLESLLPMFRVGDIPAKDVLGKPELVSVRDDRDAGLLTISDKKHEGLILVFAAGDNVLAFVSSSGYPGKSRELRDITYMIAAQVEFSGAQDALYGALYGG